MMRPDNWGHGTNHRGRSGPPSDTMCAYCAPFQRMTIHPCDKTGRLATHLQVPAALHSTYARTAAEHLLLSNA